MSYSNCCVPSYQAASYQSSHLEHIVYNEPVYQSAQAVRSPSQMVYGTSSAFDLERAMAYASLDHQRELYKNSTDLLYHIQRTQQISVEYAFTPDDFLRPKRLNQPFVHLAQDVEEEVKEAFFHTTNMQFPTDVKITVLSHNEFRKQMKAPGVIGFSINRKKFGFVSDVVVKADEKDRLLLTIGHEIGHVFTNTLSNKHDEEAKAFSFSRAWMNAIKKENIAGLQNAIVLDNPAHNGLHDVSCAFVSKHVQRGKDPLDLHWDLVYGKVSVHGLS